MATGSGDNMDGHQDTTQRERFSKPPKMVDLRHSKGGISFSDITGTGQARQHMGHHYGNVTNNYHGTTDINLNDTGHWLVKRRPNPSFTGQHKLLQDMYDTIIVSDECQHSSTRQYVLQGMGGIGKSEAALQFARRHRKQFWAVFWVNFGDLKSARADFAQIALKCRINLTSDEDIFEEVNAHLSDLDLPWLFIMDNCDDPDVDYSDFLPDNGKGSVIVTTRLDIGAQYGSLGWRLLDGLEGESAFQLLLKVAGITHSQHQFYRNTCYALVAKLAFHPLAINVVGALIREGLYNLGEYLVAFDEQQTELLQSETKQFRSTYGTVHATFEISFGRLQDSKDITAQYAVELLAVLAFLDRDDVTEDLFSRAWSYGEVAFGIPGECTSKGSTTPISKSIEYHDTGSSSHHGMNASSPTNNPRSAEVERETSACIPELEDIELKDPDTIWSLTRWHYRTIRSYNWTGPQNLALFRKARNHLSRLALVQRNPDTQSLSMHPLVHVWARSRLSQQQTLRAWLTAACFLALTTKESWQWEEYYLRLHRHLQICFDLRPTLPLSHNLELDVGRIYYSFLRAFTRYHGRPALAIINALEDLLGRLSPHIDVAESASDIQHWKAEVLMDLEEHEAAADLIEAIHQARPRAKGVLFSLGTAYIETGQPAKALEIFSQLVSSKEATLPSEHPSRLTSEQMLGRAYLDLGQTPKAIEILQRVVEIRNRTVEQDHPQLLVTQHELARAYHYNGQSERSVPLLQAVVDAKSRTLHRADASRFMSEYNLIDTYVELDHPQKAEALLVKIEAQKHLLIRPSLPRLKYLRLRIELYELDREVRAKFRRSQVAEDNGKLDEAIVLMKEVVEAEMGFPPVFAMPWFSQFVLARQYLRSGERRDEVGRLSGAFMKFQHKLVRGNDDGKKDVAEMECTVKSLETEGARWNSSVRMWKYTRAANLSVSEHVKL